MPMKAQFTIYPLQFPTDSAYFSAESQAAARQQLQDLSTGLFLGSTLENKIALGTSSLQLIANDENTKKIIEYLRESSRGYTVVDGYGSTDKMNMILIILPRKDALPVLKAIRKLCQNNVFVIASEVSKYAGGYGMVK